MAVTRIARVAPESTLKLLRPLKLYACVDCGGRFPRKDLIEVSAEAAVWSMTAREGERLCRSCGIAHGVL